MDQKMQEMRVAIGDPTKIAVLAALNIAIDYSSRSGWNKWTNASTGWKPKSRPVASNLFKDDHA